MPHRVISIASKEAIEIRRDPRLLGMTILLPVMMLVLYTYAVNFDIKVIHTVICNLDTGSSSRELIRRLEGSGYFHVSHLDRYQDIDHQLDAGRYKLALCFPHDFSQRLARGDPASLQAIIDGSDANTATIIISYLNQIVQGYFVELTLTSLQNGSQLAVMEIPPIDMGMRVWYNPELRSVNFMLPGLLAMVMMVVGTMVTSLSIVSERERSTFEKLIVTPVRPYELLIGKMLPYVVLIFADTVLCILVGRFWFGVPIKGSVELLLGVSVVFLFSALGLGMFISTVTQTQRVAMLMAMFAATLPTFLLSGFIFPIENMPVALQIITYLVPARYFVEALRGIYLKGTGLEVFWFDVVLLCGFAVLMMVISAIRFRKRLDA